MAFYSKKYSNLSDLPNKSTLGIPNDPSQGGRALILLASQGLIKLKDSKNLLSSPLDIVSNPHHYNIIELEAAQLPHSLSDLDAAAHQWQLRFSRRPESKQRRNSYRRSERPLC